QLTEATFSETVIDDHEPTELDQQTELTEFTQVDATAIDDTQLTEAAFGETVIDDHEPTELDQQTELTEFTQVDATAIDDTAFTEITALEPQSSHDISETEKDFGSDDETEINDDEFDAALIGQIAQSRDDTQFDQTDISSRDQTEIKDDIEMEFQSQLAEEDRTLLINDSANQSLEEGDEQTSTKTIEMDVFSPHHQQNEEENLTQDDVIQFMGDGISEHSSPLPSISEDEPEAEIEHSDDTTQTNPESLTMTNYSFSDHEEEEPETDEVMPRDLTESDTFSLFDLRDPSLPDQAFTESSIPQDILEDDKSTRLNTDSTSTISSIDIEKLTNDQTVTIGSKTSTQTFAPDNYDRTLLNLSQKDVSRIFPGMQPESDQVMTPDYAKRVFLSKSGQFKTQYYKLYSGIGLLLLLSIIMWGLFHLQEESEFIDQRLVNLKRDPMPGVIKPQNEDEADKLFLPESKESKFKAVAIISKVDEIEADLSTPLESKNQVLAEIEQQNSLAEQNEATVSTTETDTTDSDSVEIASEAQAKTDVNRVARNVKPTEKIESPQAKSSGASTLSISSGSQVSQKSQILNEAYDAYEKNDIASARKLYTEVLAIDATDRDGLLGRAAIHVLENEYQQAIEKYQQLLIENPKDSMAMASLISVANIDPQLGETQLKGLLREQPDSPYLHFVLGNMYGGQNRWNDAQSSYFEAMQKKPDNPNYAYNLAVSLEHIGKTKSALTFYEKALANSSTGVITFDQQLVRQRLEALAQ
ncbi:MAG: tetratricopeptide repeat protein, partial [Gammaproteobacteria bacterium]|nr:tetratricopeptide repeat protein [Gammaproteobacteria bacterium]